MTGILTGLIIVSIGDAIAGTMFKVDPAINFQDKEAVKKMMESIPVTVMVIMLLFWLLSSFTAGIVAALIDREHSKRNSIICGCILLAGAIANLYLIPHPVWMTAIAVVGYVPAAYFGGRIISSRS